VKNGQTDLAIETLEKLMGPQECPPYQLVCDGEKPPNMPGIFKSSNAIARGQFRQYS
jgi:hypothetical protein